MRYLLAAALLAATCQRQPVPVPTPEPAPTETTEPTSGDPCEVAWTVQADAECAPAAGHDEWLKRCGLLPVSVVDCVMRVESCAYMRACLEQAE